MLAKSRAPSPLDYLIAFLLYFLFAAIGLQFAKINQFASPIWPASGVSIFLFQRYGQKIFFPIWFAAFASNALFNGSPTVAMFIGFGNAIEGLMVCALFKSWKRSDELGNRNLNSMIWIGAVAVASSFSAACGATSLLVAGTISKTDILGTFSTWWVGDFLGGLIFFRAISTPINLRSLNRKHWRSKTIQVISAALYFTCLGLLPVIATKIGVLYGSIFVLFIFSYLAFDYLGESTVAKGFAIYSVSVLVIESFGSIGQSKSYANMSILFAEGLVFACYIVFEFLSNLKAQDDFRSVRTPLIASWIISGVIVCIIGKEVAQESHESTKRKSMELKSEIADLTNRYAQELRAGEALYKASNEVSQEEWSKFAGVLETAQRMPAATNIGVIFPVSPDHISAYEKKQSTENLSSFSVRPVPGFSLSKDRSYVITRIAPLDRNIAAMGLDLASEPKRKMAVDLAMQTNTSVLSAPIKLVQDSNHRLGFLLIHPVIDTKRGNFWIYSPLIGELFFEPVKNKFKDFHFRIFDDEFKTDGDLNSDPYFTNRKINDDQIEVMKMRIGSRDYVIHLIQSNRTVPTGYVSFVTICLTMLSIVVATYIAMQESIRLQSQKLALEMHEELESRRAATHHLAKMSALGEMAGGIAHEVNNPLSIIVGYSDQVSQALKSKSFTPEILSEKLDKVILTAERIAKIVKGLRNFSRSGDSDPMESASVNKIVGDAIDLCGEKMKTLGITLSVEIEQESFVLCRSVQLTQVILNLLNNSSDAIATSSNRWIKITSKKQGNTISIEVIDSGPGIPEELVERIMLPFFTTKEAGKGTGLGLSISANIAKDHGGRLRYESLNQNTRFIIELPRFKST